MSELWSEDQLFHAETASPKPLNMPDNPLGESDAAVFRLTARDRRRKTMFCIRKDAYLSVRDRFMATFPLAVVVYHNNEERFGDGLTDDARRKLNLLRTGYYWLLPMSHTDRRRQAMHSSGSDSLFSSFKSLGCTSRQAQWNIHVLEVFLYGRAYTPGDVNKLVWLRPFFTRLRKETKHMRSLLTQMLCEEVPA